MTPIERATVLHYHRHRLASHGSGTAEALGCSAPPKLASLLALARRAFESVHAYWGWRLTGWCCRPSSRTATPV